jgi:hydroxyacylglutathione hydrolase
MPLEDHPGDLLAKARARSGVTLEAAAQAVGLPPGSYAEIESSGRIPSSLELAPLARLIQLDACKFQAIVDGWLPQPRDLARWPHLHQIVTEDEGATVNSYLIWDEATRIAALFDTGWNTTELRRLVAAHTLRLKTLFITHAHTDHVAALDEIVRHFPGVRVRRQLADGEGAGIGNLHIRVRPTPGHAAEGLTWVIEGWPGGAPAVAVVGDAIFAGSIGRGFQSWRLAVESVREQIFTLPPDTLLCPGHGPVTTVAEELAHNPFFPTLLPA